MKAFAALWESYAGEVLAGCPPIQKQECRRAFYAGAAAFVSCFICAGRQGADRRALRRARRIQKISPRRESMTNPTEKPKEPAFIRDITAAEAGFEFGSMDKLVELCKGFQHHCEYCGAGPFPLFPMSEWAEHLLAAHRHVMTMQQEQATMLFCVAGFTPAVSQWLSMQLITRVDLRRRAYELGILRLAAPEPPADKPRIHFPS